MSEISRRNFLKFAGMAGGAALVSAPDFARAEVRGGNENALLIDTTVCVGCRGCEAACTEANALPAPPHADERAVFAQKRDTTTTAFTVVNQFENPKDKSARYVKKQCMHCVDPACASACLGRALDKTKEGPVVYHKENCLGCRYCMVACPFEIPRFEYDKAAATIKKCEMCHARGTPACAKACPSGALQFGKRGELIELAKTRIYQNPDKYVHHVYGELEAGGTNVMYLADVKFEQLGLKKDLPEKAYPELTSGALGLVPFVMTLWPPLLMGIHHFSKSRKAEEAKAAATEDKHHG